MRGNGTAYLGALLRVATAAAFTMPSTPRMMDTIASG